MSTGTLIKIPRTTMQTGIGTSATPDDFERPLLKTPIRHQVLVDDFGDPSVFPVYRAPSVGQASAQAADAQRTVILNWNEIVDEPIKEGKTIWDTPSLQALLNGPLGSPVELTREEADEIVRLSFGRRPDLPPGKQIVEEVRELLGHSLIERLKDTEQE